MNTNHKFINDIKDYMYNAMWEVYLKNECMPAGNTK